MVGVARSYDRLVMLEGEMKSLGGRFNAVKCDIPEKQQVFDTVEEFVDGFGCIDVLLNKTRVGLYGLFQDISLEEVETQVRVNFMGATYLATLPHMLKQKYGRIVNVSSLAGFVAVPKMNLYCARLR
ncbi:MAG: SDR family NAD(P)-dependent oxidoreductase [Candidatus Caldarchaeum sp.]